MLFMNKEKGRGLFRKTKAYGLVCSIALAMAFISSGTAVSADDYTIKDVDESSLSTTDSLSENLVADNVELVQDSPTPTVESGVTNEVEEGSPTLVKLEEESSPEALADTQPSEPVVTEETKNDNLKEVTVEDTDKVTLILQINPDGYDQTLNRLRELKDVEVRFEYREVFSGASIRLNPSQLQELVGIEGVTKVEKSQKYYPQMLRAEELINALKLSNKYQHDGRGMVIAVVDSGIDTRHKDMRLDKDVVPKIKEVTKTVEGELTLKVPHGYNFLDKNYKLIDEFERPHGMHIAGILAGNATDEDLKNNLGIDGIAPNAQLLSYKVFSDREDNQIAVIDDTVFAAIEDAIKHQADVISLSIGSYGTGKPSDAFYQAVRRAKEKGIIVVASMGNAGASSATTSYDKYTNDAFDQEDVATTVTVAANLDVIGVGSSAHLYREGHTVTIGETEFFYGPVSYSRFENGEYEFVDAGSATEAELADLNLEGKVAIIARSSESPKLQFDRLRAKGILGVVSYNTNTGRNRDYYKTELQHILEENVAKDIWGMTLSQNDGLALKALVAKNPVQTVTYAGVKVKKITDKDEVSGFSSWGSTVDLELKPEIVAPGESIYSTFNHNRYGIMSGTSMSTPVVAGAATILLPKFKSFNHPMNIVDFAKIMMMNTADPLKDTTGYENSPRQQGAGMLNVQDAFDNHVLVTHDNKAFVALKEVKADQTSFTVTLENLSDEVESFTVRPSEVLTTGVFPVQKGEELVKELHSTKIDGASLVSDTKQITLQPKEKKTLTFTLTSPVDFQNKFIEGYIYFDSETNPSLAIPYFGFKGDWQKDDIIDRPMWEEKSKTKLTSLMTTSSLSSDKYVPLGLSNPKDKDSQVNPDFIAISSTESGRVTGSAFLRLAVLRDLVDFQVDVVAEKSEDALPLTVLQRGDFLERFRYVDFFENDYFSKKYVNPEESIRWDGRVYDAKVGDKVAAKEGQYYVRVRVRNDLNKPYQTTYLPIKIDNTPPTAHLSTESELLVTAQDNNAIWYVEAKIGDKVYETVKVSDNQYAVKGLPVTSTEDVKISVVDIAGNTLLLTHPMKRPALAWTNLEEVKTKRRSTTLMATKQDDVSDLSVYLDDELLTVSTDANDVSIDLENLTDGEHSLRYVAHDANGHVLGDETISFVRDTSAPELEFDIEMDDDEEYPLITDGYALIRGHVKDGVSSPEQLKLYYYLNKDRLNQDKKNSLTVDEDGNFEVKIYLSDYPESVVFEAVDEAGRKTVKQLFLQEVDEEEPVGSPFTVHLDRTNYFLKEENIGDNLHQDESDPNLFTYNLRLSSDEPSYLVKINGSDFMALDEDGNLTYALPLRNGANMVDIEGYDDEKNLIMQRKYFFFVDTEMPKYHFENFDIMPKLEEEADSNVKGTIYLPSERYTFKGTAEDNGLGWSLFINDSIVRRGKAWREFGLNKETFSFETSFKDNDFLKLRLVDYFGNSENDNYTKYRVKIDNEQPSVVFEPSVYKKEAVIKVAFSDNYGLKEERIVVDGREVVNGASISGIGTHRYQIKAVDYAGNETVLEGEFKIVGELAAEQIKTTVTPEEFSVISRWLSLKDGTEAKVVRQAEGTVEVLLWNGLEEKTVTYNLTVSTPEKETTNPTDNQPSDNIDNAGTTVEDGSSTNMTEMPNTVTDSENTDGTETVGISIPDIADTPNSSESIGNTSVDSGNISVNTGSTELTDDTDGATGTTAFDKEEVAEQNNLDNSSQTESTDNSVEITVPIKLDDTDLSYETNNTTDGIVLNEHNSSLDKEVVQLLSERQNDNKDFEILSDEKKEEGPQSSIGSRYQNRHGKALPKTNDSANPFLAMISLILGFGLLGVSKKKQIKS